MRGEEYLATFVIAANQVDSIRIADFESQEEEEGLHTVKATIDEISHEQVVCFRTIIANFEQLFQVIELAVDITTNLGT